MHLYSNWKIEDEWPEGDYPPSISKLSSDPSSIIRGRNEDGHVEGKWVPKNWAFLYLKLNPRRGGVYGE